MHVWRRRDVHLEQEPRLPLLKCSTIDGEGMEGEDGGDSRAWRHGQEIAKTRRRWVWARAGVASGEGGAVGFIVRAMCMRGGRGASPRRP